MNWQEFLRISDNKTELFFFLARSVVGIDTNKQVITTHNTDVLCINRQDVSGLAPCTHEEADTRILLHLEDAVRHGNTRVSMRTVDTDAVVLAVASAQCLNISELWIAFGAGKSFRFLACHEIARALGPDWCITLLIFRAFTGCIQCPVFQAEVRGLHGTPGMHMEMSPLHSVPWLPGQPHNHTRMVSTTGMICHLAICLYQ